MRITSEYVSETSVSTHLTRFKIPEEYRLVLTAEDFHFIRLVLGNVTFTVNYTL